MSNACDKEEELLRKSFEVWVNAEKEKGTQKLSLAEQAKRDMDEADAETAFHTAWANWVKCRRKNYPSRMNELHT